MPSFIALAPRKGGFIPETRVWRNSRGLPRDGAVEIGTRDLASAPSAAGERCAWCRARHHHLHHTAVATGLASRPHLDFRTSRCKVLHVVSRHVVRLAPRETPLRAEIAIRFAGKRAAKMARAPLSTRVSLPCVAISPHSVTKIRSSTRLDCNSIRLSVATFIDSNTFRRHRGFEQMKARRKRAKAAASKGAAKKAPKKKKARRKKAKKK